MFIQVAPDFFTLCSVVWHRKFYYYTIFFIGYTFYHFIICNFGKFMLQVMNCILLDDTTTHSSFQLLLCICLMYLYRLICSQSFAITSLRHKQNIAGLKQQNIPYLKVSSFL